MNSYPYTVTLVNYNGGTQLYNCAFNKFRLQWYSTSFRGNWTSSKLQRKMSEAFKRESGGLIRRRSGPRWVVTIHDEEDEIKWSDFCLRWS